MTSDLKSVDLAKYAGTLENDTKGDGKIAVVYAQGSIVDGDGEDDEIGGEKFS